MSDLEKDIKKFHIVKNKDVYLSLDKYACGSSFTVPIKEFISELQNFLLDNNLDDGILGIGCNYDGYFDDYSLTGNRPKTEQELQKEVDEQRKIYNLLQKELRDRRKERTQAEKALYLKLKKKYEST